MENSRYKRRDKNTKRRLIDGLTSSSVAIPITVRYQVQDAPTALTPKPLTVASTSQLNSAGVTAAQFNPNTSQQPASIAAMAPQFQGDPAVNRAPVTSTKLAAAPASPATRIRLDMGLPGQADSLYHPKTIIHHGKRRAARRWAMRATVAVLVLSIGVGGLLLSQGYLKLHKVFHGTTKTVAALQKNVNPNLLKGEGDGRINVLLMGRGGSNHDGPDLTDTMMLASIDPVNHTATLLSIPRDLWVDVPDQGAMKINAAWESGEFKYEGKVSPGSTAPQAIQAGFNEADQTVESVLGVPIDYNMIMDFSAFQQAVDTVGGLTINVPTALVDPTMAWQNNNNPVLAQAGLQSFNGSQTLNYVRSRETTSDFARAQRQRAVMLALKDKVETLGTISNPLKLSGLLGAFGNNISTDLSLNDASRMYSIVKGITTSNVTSVGLADAPNNYVTTGNLNGQSIDLPTAGMFNYGAIQGYVRSQLKDPYITKENAKVSVLNGTAQSGLANSEATTLQSYGYNVIGAASTPTVNYQQTTVVDLSGGKDSYTKHYLEQRFNTTAVTKLPDNAIQTNGAAFVIILGSDQTTNSQG